MFEMKATRFALLEIQKAQAWCGNRVINDDDENELDDIKTAEDAIDAAIKRARTTRKRTSCRSLLHVSCESRPSREFEVIWWPDMYESSDYGKMPLRYYVGKVFHSWTTKLKILSENFVMLSLHAQPQLRHKVDFTRNDLFVSLSAGKFSQHAATTKIMSASGRQKLYGVTSL